jgi:uncharacterized protein YbcI
VPETHEREVSPLTTISNAMVRLHKEQFGRGPTHARSSFAGPDMLLCVLKEAMLPAELKMAAMGAEQSVRESRVAFQEATRADFIDVVEEIVHRKVRAFGSAIDVDQDTIFECYEFEPSQPSQPSHDGAGAVSGNHGADGAG